MATYLTKYAEEIFEAKCITAKTDWLAIHREPDQRFLNYKNDPTSKVKWITNKKNKLYLYAPSLNQDMVKSYRAYAQAFFTGVAGVSVLKPDQIIPGPMNENKPNPARVPADFIQS